MAHKVKCAICGVTFDRDVVQAVKHNGNRFSHYTCEPDKELVPLPEKSKEDLDLQELKNYINNLYGKKCNWALINKQIKDYHSNNNYTYKGMMNTLYWFYEVKHNSPADSNGGIGIIPFTYDNAKEYFHSLYLAKMKNDNKDINSYTPKEVVVTIKNPHSKKPVIKMFDMDWEEE